MQKPHKAYRMARKNHKWMERHQHSIKAFWLANIIVGAALLIYRYGHLWFGL